MNDAQNTAKLLHEAFVDGFWRGAKEAGRLLKWEPISMHPDGYIIDSSGSPRQPCREEPVQESAPRPPEEIAKAETEAQEIIAAAAKDPVNVKGTIQWAACQMRFGRRVRRPDWDFHLSMHPDGYIITSSGLPWHPSEEDLSADDWELSDPKPQPEQPKPPEVHDIKWAVRQMLDGKKVRLPRWGDGVYIAGGRFLGGIQFGYGHMFAPTPSQILAENWEIYEEGE